MPAIIQNCDGQTRTYFLSNTPVDARIAVINTGTCPFRIIFVREGEANIVQTISQREVKEFNITLVTKIRIKCLTCDCGTACLGEFFFLQ